jgi:hypothetical protein
LSENANTTATSLVMQTEAAGGAGLVERARMSSDGTFRVKGAGTAGSTDAFQVSGSAPASAASINSSGNLLVGSAGGPTQGVLGLTGNRTSSGQASNLIFFYNNSTTQHAFIISARGATDAGAGSLFLGVGSGDASTAQLGITSTGLAVNGLLDISASTSGQIQFPATQNASSNANTLDDYEEGTWTPSIGGTATYTSQTGTYTKIGNVVTIRGILSILLKGTGSASEITGLPFAGNSNRYAGSVSNYGNLAVNVLFLGTFVQTSTLYFISQTTAGTTVTDTPAILGNSAYVTFSATYLV